MPRTPATLLLASLALGPSVSMAAESVDLVQMQRDYGWRSVATVVGSLVGADTSSAQIRRTLDDGGLAMLEMPVRLGDEEIRDRFSSVTPLTGCGWAWDVVCGFTAQTRTITRDAKGFDVHCLDGEGARIADVTFEVRVRKRAAAGTTAQIDVWDLSGCWRAGGTELSVQSRTP